jgi:hypothetical protein
MGMSRRWWEPAAQEGRLDSEGPARDAFDLGDLMSLSMCGGEYAFSHFAELFCADLIASQGPTSSCTEMRRHPIRRISDE